MRMSRKWARGAVENPGRRSRADGGLGNDQALSTRELIDRIDADDRIHAHLAGGVHSNQVRHLDLDTRRDVLVSMAENLDRATPEQRRELIELLVQRVDIAGGAVVGITWTPAAAAFFAASAGEAVAR